MVFFAQNCILWYLGSVLGVKIVILLAQDLVCVARTMKVHTAAPDSHTIVTQIAFHTDLFVQEAPYGSQKLP